MTRAVSALADAVVDRSLGRCEALWNPGVRCLNRADEIHHRLPRSRARTGDEHLLDLAGDVDNLAHLCQPCHTAAHGNPERAQTARLSGPYGDTRTGVRRGIVVPGQITTDDDGRPVYTGPHPAYAARYPRIPR